MKSHWFAFRRTLACLAISSAFAFAADSLSAQAPANSSSEESSEPTANEPAATEPAEKLPAAKRGSAKKVPLDPALELTDPRTYQLKVVHRVEAPDGAVNNVVVVGPVPIEWPEQQLRLLSQKTSPGVRLTDHVMKGQGAILRMQVALDPQGRGGLCRAAV